MEITTISRGSYFGNTTIAIISRCYYVYLWNNNPIEITIKITIYNKYFGP